MSQKVSDLSQQKYLPVYILLELFLRVPLALVKKIPQEENNLGFEVSHCRLKGSLHLPFSAEFVKPMTLPETKNILHSALYPVPSMFTSGPVSACPQEPWPTLCRHHCQSTVEDNDMTRGRGSSAGTRSRAET